ncbi:glycosyltransferase family 4 protein [Mesobacillus foraminis]|uniref:Glycosyltransferase involved in cell wall biosynthesis n=1 Tax=Mesobacillus foraminis TaxID=279826 RepID=A0A4R2BCE9_9BACI|nr:glycosyltransferase family 4 protein [Mesobacillus foraminis]TCN24163.1 glycosyltransferase involved in cell wall biosynthesis [Mesobacillus foraminis]
MRILLISNMYPDKEHPGFGVFVKHTENILNNEGFIIDKVVRYKKNNIFSKLFDYLIFYLKIFFKGLFKRYDVFYIHFAAHPSIPVLFVKFFNKKVKVITNVHGTDVVPENKIHELFQIFVDRLLNISECIIAPSDYFKDLVSKQYNIPKDKIKTFPSGGISKEIFYPIENKKEIFKKLNLDSNLQYLGYVGRIEYGKGWDTFLESLRDLKEEMLLENKKVIFVGYGDQLNLFHEKVKNLGLQDTVIHFKYMQQSELNLVYNILDFFCFPTERKGESLGLVGIEAMACGTPVIGSRIAGLQSYIENGHNGYLFEPKSKKELGLAIRKYYSLNKETINKLKINSFKTSQRYEKANIKGVLSNIFKNV